MKTNKMMNFLKDFRDCKENDRNKRIASKKIITFCEKNNINNADDMLNYSENDFKKLISHFNPSSLVETSNLIYRISEIFKEYCRENKIEWDNSTLTNIDKNEFWFSFKKENDLKRYFSDKKYRDIIEHLNKEILFDGNDLYYKTLFMAIYEGIYNKNLTEIKNLRTSDINMETNIVTLRDDNNNVRELEITDELKNSLVELSKVNVWYKIQGRSQEPIGRYIGGEYNDSVFKVLAYNNKDKAKSYKEFYYRRLKTLCEEFLGYNTTPMQIFVSGIVNRVYRQMKNFDVTIDDLRDDENNLTSTVRFFIRKECDRVHYNTNIHSFMRILKSYADIFDDNIE